MFGFRRYFSGWASDLIKNFDTRPTIRDTGRGSSRRVRYRGPPQDEPQTYEEIKQRGVEEGTPWEDPDFPAEDSSIFYREAPSVYPIEWLRPHEICSDPQLFVGGASRLDVNQGILGDCWLLAAVASLASNERLLHRVVNPNQSFQEEYAGVFRFEFWQYGRWVEVLVDDRLPTHDGKLIYMHSTERNEFWTALLEKAYAKLNGCYENLSGGTTSEALTDFTGGVIERFNFREEEPPDFKLLVQAFSKESMMGCSIDASPDQMEASLDNGLIIGHAYTVTCVKCVEVETPTVSGVIPMVRVRNPWGNECEWKGPWSDQSEEWQFIPSEEREEMGLTFSHDGEFWMAYQDFTTNFQRMEVCYLGPDSMPDEDDEKRIWESTLVDGNWRRRVNAGGCMNYPQTFWTNPQYKFSITDPDENDDEEVGTLIVGLMQKERRKMKSRGQDNLTIGYAIYEIEDPECGTLGRQFFRSNRFCAKSPAFINMREVSGHHRLPPGHYAVIPCTFEPNEEADYVLRVFSEKKNEAKELDNATGTAEPQEEIEVETDPDEEAEKKEAALATFREMAGVDMEIDAYELKEILKSAYSLGFEFEGFSTDVCRGLVAVRDTDFTGKLGFDEFQQLYDEFKEWETELSGTLGFEEFTQLYDDFKEWEKIYKYFDADGSGQFNSMELRAALMQLGYRLSNRTFNAVVMRYSDKDGFVHFDDFIACLVKLKTMFEIFKYKDPELNGDATFQLDEFVQMTMYS